MINDFTISSMYLFIHQKNNGGAYSSWISEADANGDGTLIKAELEQWLKEELPMSEGFTPDDVRGTIDEFWYGLDINRSAREIRGTRLNNLHALDKDEIKRMERIVKEMEEYNELLTQIDAPENLNLVNKVKWTEDVKAALKKEVDNWILGGAEDSFDVWQKYEEVVFDLTPAITIDDMQIDYEALFKKYGYNISESPDKEALIPLIKDYLSSKSAEIANAEDFEWDVVDKIETFVEQFMAEALLDEDQLFINNPHSKGFVEDPNVVKMTNFSDLQKQVAGWQLYEDIINTRDEDWYPLFEAEGILGKDKFEVIDLLRQASDKDLDARTGQDYRGIHDDILNIFKNNDEVQAGGVRLYFDKMVESSNAARDVIADGLTALGKDAEYILGSYCDDLRNQIENAMVASKGSLSPNITKDIIEALANMEYITPDDFEKGWEGDSIGVVATNSSKAFNCRLVIQENGEDFELKYEPRVEPSNIGSVKNLGNGSFTFTSNSTAGTCKVVIAAFINGLPAGEQELNVVVVNKEISKNHISNPNGEISCGTGDTKHGGNWLRPEDAKKKAIENMKNFVNTNIKETLVINGNYDTAALEKAATETIKYYEDIINSMPVYDSTLLGLKETDGEYRDGYVFYARYSHKKMEDCNAGDVRYKLDLSGDGWAMIEVEKSALINKFNQIYSSSIGEE